MQNGWIKLHRKLRDSFIWEEKPFSKAQAWIDLLLRATHKEQEVLVGNTVVKLKPGQVLTSQVQLAEDWGWSRHKVQNFLNLLQEMEQIFIENGALKRARKYTLLTITNWEFYQMTDGKKSTKKSTQGALEEHLRSTYKNVKNNNKNILTDIFSHILNHWNSQNIVQHRKLTENMRKAINARLEDFSPEEIKEAITNYAKIYHSPKYFLKYKFRLEDFLSRGAGSYMEKFLTVNDPFSSYLRDEERRREYEDETPAQRMLRELREKKAKQKEANCEVGDDFGSD